MTNYEKGEESGCVNHRYPLGLDCNQDGRMLMTKTQEITERIMVAIKHEAALQFERWDPPYSLIRRVIREELRREELNVKQNSEEFNV